MRKLLLVLTLFMFALSSFAAVSSTSPIKIDPADKSTSITLQQFVNLSPKEYSALTGKKLGLFQKAELKFAQKKLANTIKKNASLKHMKIDALKREPISGAYWAGAALGAFLGPIGVLIAYLINDDNKQERVRAAWRGFIIFLGVVVVTLIQLS